MKTVLAVLLGLIWGAAAALVNAKISADALRKNSSSAIRTASAGRMAVDAAALGLVFLLRGVLPLPYEVVLVATAVSLSLCTIFYSFRMSKSLKETQDPNQRKEGE